MNQDLSQIVIYYATKPHEELADLLLSKSKDNLIACLNDLLTAYINDKNSSSLREFVTVSIAGYKHNSNKLGYNGYKQNSSIGGKPINCEAKPKNIQTDGYEEKKTKSKLNGEGGFNDYTVKRLEKDANENLNLLCSGFVDGELQYILEFPFSAIYDRLKTALAKLVGPYLRSATFNFSHYQDCKNLKIIYCNIESVKKNKKYFTKNLYNFLIKEQ
jgi:hypothetical protein